METEELLVQRNHGVVTVTLNRPGQKNAVTRPMWRQLADLFTDVSRRRDDQLLILTGAGDAFCSGADLGRSDPTRMTPVEVMKSVAEAAGNLLRLPKPSIARVDGPAVGAGLGLALACDVVVASERAQFGASFAKRALSADFATSWLLPRMIGLHAAKELVLLAEMVGAERAFERGLVNRVVPHDELDAAVAEYADRLLSLPQLALSLSKDLLNRSFDVTIEQALEAEAYAQVVNLTGPDVEEARAAFLEKREPVFYSKRGSTSSDGGE